MEIGVFADRYNRNGTSHWFRGDMNKPKLSPAPSPHPGNCCTPLAPGANNLTGATSSPDGSDSLTPGGPYV